MTLPTASILGSGGHPAVNPSQDSSIPGYTCPPGTGGMYSGSTDAVSMRASASEAITGSASMSILWEFTEACLPPSPTVSFISLRKTSRFWVIRFCPNRTEASLVSVRSAMASGVPAALTEAVTKSSISFSVIICLPPLQCP